jgi:PleD family two-component response regulator
VVLLTTDVDGAKYVAQKIVEALGDILKSLGFGGDDGVADYLSGSPSESLIADADSALYEAKRESGNTYRIFKRDR